MPSEELDPNRGALRDTEPDRAKPTNVGFEFQIQSLDFLRILTVSPLARAGRAPSMFALIHIRRSTGVYQSAVTIESSINDSPRSFESVPQLERAAFPRNGS